MIVTGAVAGRAPLARRGGGRRGAADDRARHPEQGARGDGDGPARRRLAGAFEGIEAEPGRDLLVADSAEDQADAMLALLDEPERAAAMGRAAGPAWSRIMAGRRGSRRSPTCSASIPGKAAA